MQYRTLGRTNLQVSTISLGTEYLIDNPREHVVSVIRTAIERGINYFDLFFAQPNFRDNMSEAFRGYRDQVYMAAHLGSIDRDGQYEKTRDLDLSEAFFLDFLKRYDTDYVDLLFLHNSDGQEDYDTLMQPGGLLDMAKKLRDEGKARFIAFSGHTVSTALQAVKSGEIDVLMFPINLASHAIEGKNELLDACVAENVGLVSMKPFAGGALLKADDALELGRYYTGGDTLNLRRGEAITPVQCLSYVLAQVGVSTVVPGCKNLAELDASLSYWDASPKERDYSTHISQFQQYVTGECVFCNHCLPCPSHIDIGQTTRLLQLARVQMSDAVRQAYDSMPTNASDCIQCGSCEERCPFGVEVISNMEDAAELFA